MNKEYREALKELKWLYNQNFKVNGWHFNGDLEPLNNFIDNFYEDVVKSLTPPTADEVIKALSEYFKGLTGVWYDKKTKSFIHLQYGRNEVISRCFEARLNDKRVTVIVTLPPHLITMIGKFYESLEEEK